MLRLIAGIVFPLLMLILLPALLGMVFLVSKLGSTDQVAIFHSDYVDHLGIFDHHRLTMLDVDRRLQAHLPLPGYALAAHWSADGEKLLMQLVPDGDAPWQLHPFWEWDGEKLTNRQDLLNTIFDFDTLPSGDLVLVQQMNGAAVVRVTPDGTQQVITPLAGAFTIDASPDGNWAVVNGVDQQGKMFTRIVNLTTGEHRLVTPTTLALSTLQYAWAGTTQGDLLLYIRGASGQRGLQQQHVSTGIEQMLVERGVNGPLMPSWDGKWLALIGLYGYSSSITLLDLADPAAPWQGIPDGSPFVHNLTWSPGGKVSYFAMLPQNWVFMVHDSITSKPRALLVVDEKIAPPVWRPR